MKHRRSFFRLARASKMTIRTGRHRSGSNLAAFLFAAVLLAAIPVGAQEAPAETGPAPVAVLAIVDIQRVLNDAAAAQSIRSQMESFRVEYLAEITEQENKLREDDQELARQRTILSPEAFAEREREFRLRVDAVQQRVQAISRALDARFSESMNLVRETMIPIFAELTRERGINVIVAKTQIIFASRTLDVTDEVIRRVDLALPDVAIAPPAVE